MFRKKNQWKKKLGNHRTGTMMRTVRQKKKWPSFYWELWNSANSAKLKKNKQNNYEKGQMFRGRLTNNHKDNSTFCHGNPRIEEPANEKQISLRQIRILRNLRHFRAHSRQLRSRGLNIDRRAKSLQAKFDYRKLTRRTYSWAFIFPNQFFFLFLFLLILRGFAWINE